MVFTAFLQSMADQSAAVLESIQRTLAAFVADDDDDAYDVEDPPLVIVIRDGKIEEAFEPTEPRVAKATANEDIDVFPPYHDMDSQEQLPSPV